MTPSEPSRPFLDSYLVDYSAEHVAYEFDMLLTLSSLISRLHAVHAPTPEDEQCLKNALLESCVVHVRNVIRFLYPQNVQSTDIVASDFFDPGVWDSRRPAITDSLKAARRRANKEIAHMTSARMAGTPPEKAWNFSLLAAELLPIMKLMVKDARPDKMSPSLAKRFG
jgi:hypothetical protein